MKLAKMLLGVVLAGALSACVSAPQGLNKEQYSLHSLNQISSADYQCQCKTIRVGGRILKAEALPKHMKLEVLSLPINNYSGKPNLDGAANGRFIAYLDGFIDPALLQDQFITLGGRLVRQEAGKIDQAPYRFPVIQAQHYRLWQLAKSYAYPFDDWDDWGFWGPRWGGFYTQPEIRYYLY